MARSNRHAALTDVAGVTVKWSSSDEKVATIEATGKVTAVAAGTATIKACVESVCGEVIVSIAKPPVAVQPDVAMTRVVTAGATAMNVGGGALKGGGSVRNASLEPLPGAPPRWGGEIDRLDAVGLFVSPRLYVKTTDPLCDTAADPIGLDGVPLWKTTNRAAIAPGTFYCLLKSEIGPPKTLPSAIASARQPSCTIFKLLPYEQVKFDGSKQEVRGTKPTECYSEFGSGEKKQYGPGSGGEGKESTEVAFSFVPNRPGALGKSGTWDESLLITSLTGVAAGLPRMLVTKTGDGWVAAASVLKNDAKGSDDGFAYLLDWKNGIVRFEAKTQHFSSTPEQSNDCCYSTHARFLVKGKVDENGVFSEVTHFEGVHSQLSSPKLAIQLGQTPNPADCAQLNSIKGNPKDGYKTHRYEGSCQTSPLLTSTYKDYVGCSGDAGVTCAGNDGIKITKASDLDFTMHSSAPTFTTTSAWFESLGVLSYDSITWADTQ